MQDNTKITLTLDQLKSIVRENLSTHKRLGTFNRISTRPIAEDAMGDDTKVTLTLEQIKSIVSKGYRPISETNAKRLIERHTKDGFVIISACRGYSALNAERPDDQQLDKDDPNDVRIFREINNRRSDDLLHEIERQKFSYTPIYGGYIEHPEMSDPEIVYERGYIIYPVKRNGQKVEFSELKEFSLKMAQKFDQDTIFVLEPGVGAKYLTKYGKDDLVFSGNVIFDDIAQQFFTDLHKNTQHKIAPGRRSTRFTYIESFLPPEPETHSERFPRHFHGEVF